MHGSNLGRRGGAGNDGAALAVAAICGVIACLLVLASAVDAVAPIVQQRLVGSAVVVS